MNDKDLKTILQQTFKEIYGDLGSLAEMAKKGMPSMEKQIEEIERPGRKQNLVAIEIQTAIK
nr:hypothetical protein P5644_11190 [Bacillus velezensis]